MPTRPTTRYFGIHHPPKIIDRHFDAIHGTSVIRADDIQNLDPQI
ncbi:hypothetical protein ACIA49_33170 [Kribbella sp. NPDC051587]